MKIARISPACLADGTRGWHLLVGNYVVRFCKDESMAKFHRYWFNRESDVVIQKRLPRTKKP